MIRKLLGKRESFYFQRVFWQAFRLIQEFSAISFSSDGKYLILQASRPTWHLYYYPWERGKSTGSILVSETPVIQNLFNPFSSHEFSALGANHLSICKYKDNEITKKDVILPQNNFCCHSWISKDRVLLGTADGKLVLIENDTVVRTEDFGTVKEAVNCIIPTKYGIAVGGESGTFCLYSYETGEAQLILKKSLPDSNFGIMGFSTILSKPLLLVKAANHEILKLSCFAIGKMPSFLYFFAKKTCSN